MSSRSSTARASSGSTSPSATANGHRRASGTTARATFRARTARSLAKRERSIECRCHRQRSRADTRSPFTRRKVHLAGTVEPFDDEPETTNQLEKRYFTPGNLGFEAFRATSLKKAAGGACSPVVGQLICMDRRWPEAWRCLGLSGVEIVCSGFVRPSGVSFRPSDFVVDRLRRLVLCPILGDDRVRPQAMGRRPKHLSEGRMRACDVAAQTYVLPGRRGRLVPRRLA